MNPRSALYEDRPFRLDDVPPDSLFDRVGWFYAFLRVHLFRNNTKLITRASQSLTVDHCKSLVSSQPWMKILCWKDGHYQYAAVQRER